MVAGRVTSWGRGRGRGRIRVGLVAPVVEDGHVAPAVGPAAAHEEVREAVELEVRVEEDHGVLRRLVRVRARARARFRVRVRVRVLGLGLGCCVASSSSRMKEGLEAMVSKRNSSEPSGAPGPKASLGSSVAWLGVEG